MAPARVSLLRDWRALERFGAGDVVWQILAGYKVLMIGIFSLSMFGYSTATIGNFFIDPDNKEVAESPAGSGFQAL